MYAQACLALADLKEGTVGCSVSEERLQDCVNVILSYQNGDGGWATYENTRSYSALEVRKSCLLPCAATLSPHQSGRARQACHDKVQQVVMLRDFPGAT